MTSLWNFNLYSSCLVYVYVCVCVCVCGRGGGEVFDYLRFVCFVLWGVHT